MRTLAIAAAALLAATATPAFAQQVILTPGSVIADSGSYSSQFASGLIFDNQTGTVSEPNQAGYWLNPDNGPANAFIRFDLGAAYALSSFTLFNTHNSFYDDRGTGDFTITGSNDASFATSAIVASGTLNPASSTSEPIMGQGFAATGTYRYLQFNPTSVSTQPNGNFTSPCCGANVYGLNELRVFGAAVPEPATWGMMILGFGMVGFGMRRRQSTVRTSVRFA